MPDRDRLHDWEVALLAAYSWTRTDIERLAHLLAGAHVAAIQRAANRTRQTMGASSTWEPDKEMRRQAQATFTKVAAGIAATFQDLLKHFLLRESFASVKEAVAGIASWLQTLLKWKVKQVVNGTVAPGTDKGTSLVVADALAGDLVDEETGEVIDASVYAFTVLPEESSKDICSLYAGNTYQLDEWDDVPPFPIHLLCPHERVVLAA